MLVISYRFFLLFPLFFYARRRTHTHFLAHKHTAGYRTFFIDDDKQASHVNKQIALYDATTATLSHDVTTIYGNLDELLHVICTFRGARKTPSEFSSSRNPRTLTHSGAAGDV